MVFVCAVKVTARFIQIYIYASNDDFEIDKPIVVYVILRKQQHLFTSPTLESIDVRWLKERYGNVVVMDEGEEAYRIYDECKRARKFITIPIL